MYLWFGVLPPIWKPSLSFSTGILVYPPKHSGNDFDVRNLKGCLEFVNLKVFL